MQGKGQTRGRRTFLKLGVSALAMAGRPPQAGRPRRGTAPVLRSPAQEMRLDPATGLPAEYHLRRSGIRFDAGEAGEGPSVRLHRHVPRDFTTLMVRPATMHADGRRADIRFVAAYAAGQPAAEFTLRYAVDGTSVSVTLEDVVEHPGFELISLRLPALVSVDERRPDAWLAHGDGGGDVVRLRDARAGELPPNRFWGDIHGILPVIMAGHSGAVCVQETTAFMDGTLLSVSGEAPVRRARLGTTKVFRVDGSACYDMNLGKAVPNSCGVAGTPNLMVGQTSACRLDFLEPAGKPLDWLDGARLVRARMPAIPNPFYHDKFIYGIRTDEPTFAQPSATFARCEEIIREVQALTDGAPQLVHLWGWQYRGKDTGYPAVDVVDERIGGYDGMMRLMERGKSLNATVSLSDNYDDAYRSSPAWDEAMIARKPDGELWKSRAWTGEESYIQGLAKYMEGPGPERVRYSCERYRLPGTVHVDVLSYYAIRNDWDPKRPASGIRNLVAGRYRVLEEFSKHGVDVTSEGLRYPYIGKMSMAWYAGNPVPCPFGGKPVPMRSMIYRRSAVWGRTGRIGDAATLPLMMFHGEAHHAIVGGNTPVETMLDAFYLGMVPWFRLHRLNIEGFDRDGERTVTTLEGTGNSVEIDGAANRYVVRLDGAEVARPDAVACPLGEDRIAMYALADGPLTAVLPAGWDPQRITASRLFADRRGPAAFALDGRRVTVDMTARQPVMLRYRAT